jgi:assimilatory nitrate reductase catalytic subunit
MAALPDRLNDITERFGPHLAFSEGVRLATGIEPDKLVKTHCCFCGQQCGLQLKVKDNVVIGFEPWEDFPFNRGMLCPKGVKRYLQGAHPDRLTTALARDERAVGGFQPVHYDQAVRLVAAEIDRIQSTYGKDAFAVLSGASLTIEKAYLMGKFARVCLKTANIDYNGRLCMVSAAAANKKSFGIDRAANPWSDILSAGVVLIAGANVAECAPITTNYVWQAREHGAKIIVVDPRITPIARTCDLFLPVKPGRDVALFNGILHLMIEHDWLDHDFIDNHTNGFDKLNELVKEWTPRRTAEVTGIKEKAIRQAAEMWGTARSSFLLHARGIEHHSHGVQNVMSAINIVLASGRLGREGCGYATITGQGNGQGGREHGQKCDQLPGHRDISNPLDREHIAKVWGVDEKEIPQAGVDAYEIFREIERGKIKGLLSICFNPKVSLPDNNFVTRMLEKLDFYVAIDFFLLVTGRRRGCSDADRGTRDQDQSGRRPAW